MAVILQIGHGTPDQPRSLFTNPDSQNPPCHVGQTQKLTPTSLRLIRYHCHVLRDPIAVDTPLPTRTLPTATPAPTTPSPTGTQGVVVTTLSKMLGRPQWPSLVRPNMARPTSYNHYLRFLVLQNPACHVGQTQNILRHLYVSSAITVMFSAIL